MYYIYQLIQICCIILSVVMLMSNLMDIKDDIKQYKQIKSKIMCIFIHLLMAFLYGCIIVMIIQLGLLSITI